MRIPENLLSLIPILLLQLVQKTSGGELVDVQLQELRLGQRNVCPHEEVEIVTLKEPCVQAYTKYVRSRKPGCNGKFQSCAVRQPKTIYFHTYKKVNRTRRHTIAECCPGWVHRPGEAGCQRANCSSDLCHNGGTCVPSEHNDNEQVCECPTGFTGAKCQYDINECMANNGGCEHECVNTIGTFYCRCWPGFELSTDGNTCTDIDECATANGGCSERCVNTAGGFRCDCPSDLYLHSDGRTCGKVTSCSVDNGGCDHECEDDANGEFYRCRCRPGFKLSENKRSCQAIDPCLDNNGKCQHHCTNNNGRVQCQCYPGFHLSYDRRSCVDIDECSKDNGCEHYCENIKGTYRCKCREGYQLGRDGRTCEEMLGGCQVGNGGCQHDCYDQPDGGHICKCRQGYVLADDQKLCHVKPKKDNASYGNQNQEQQLAHFRETLSNLPTAESLAELLIPSAPPLEEAYQDNHDDFPFNNVVIPSAPPMEDSHQIDVVLLDRPSHHPANTCLKTNRTSITKVSTSTTARFAAMLCCNDSKRILRAGNCHHKANF